MKKRKFEEFTSNPIDLIKYLEEKNTDTVTPLSGVLEPAPKITISPKKIDQVILISNPKHPLHKKYHSNTTENNSEDKSDFTILEEEALPHTKIKVEAVNDELYFTDQEFEEYFLNEPQKQFDILEIFNNQEGWNNENTHF